MFDQHVGQTKNGVVVESLLDGKRIPAYSNQQISALEEISIYGEDEDIPLAEIFTRFFKLENGATTSVTPKSSGAEIRGFQHLMIWELHWLSPRFPI